MNKMERLMEIMFQEDEYRYNKGEELIYHTKEDFEKEKEERNAAGLSNPDQTGLILLCSQNVKNLTISVLRRLNRTPRSIAAGRKILPHMRPVCQAEICTNFRAKKTPDLCIFLFKKVLTKLSGCVIL